jgi:hypothetical protein
MGMKMTYYHGSLKTPLVVSPDTAGLLITPVSSK